MKPSLYILEHITDDFGNSVPVCQLDYDVYMTRYNYFYGA